MTIINNIAQPAFKEFKDLKIGEVFICSNDYPLCEEPKMKIKELQCWDKDDIHSCYEILNLVTFDVEEFYPDGKIIPLKSILNLEI